MKRSSQKCHLLRNLAKLWHKILVGIRTEPKTSPGGFWQRRHWDPNCNCGTMDVAASTNFCPPIKRKNFKRSCQMNRRWHVKCWRRVSEIYEKGRVLPGIPTLVSLTQAFWKTHQKCLNQKGHTWIIWSVFYKCQHLKKKKLQQKTALLPQALSDWKCLLSQPFAVNLPLGWCYLNLKFTTFRFRQAKPGAFRPRARWVKPLKFRCSIMPEVKTPWSPQWNLRSS